MSSISPCPNASVAKAHFFRFFGAVAACLLTLGSPALAAVAGSPARGLTHPSTTASASEEPALLQFTSGGHVLGFNGDGYFVSNGTYALRVRFEGGQATAPSPENTGDGTGANAKQAATLSRVFYSEVWPGIDVTYDAPLGGIARSTWTLAPGADPTAIQLRYNSPVHVTPTGELGLRFETGSMTESRPVAWQEVAGHRRPVEVAFKSLAGDLVGFRVGQYRRDLPLVIDPTITWNTFLGGSGKDVAHGIGIDTSPEISV